MEEFVFKPIIQRQRRQEHFDRENIMMTKAGQTFNVYDYIQEQRDDTELYPTLQKYGCIPQQLLDTNKAFADFTEFNDLRDLNDQQIKAKEMFYNLPADIRQKFNNNIGDFVKNGFEYLKAKIAEETAQNNNTMTAQPVGSKIEEVKNG